MIRSFSFVLNSLVRRKLFCFSNWNINTHDPSHTHIHLVVTIILKLPISLVAIGPKG